MMKIRHTPRHIVLLPALLSALLCLIYRPIAAHAAHLPTLNWIQLSDWVNVKTVYGAVGNGTTDDTAAIQAALNGAASGGIVYFPPGNYKISSTLHLTGSGPRHSIQLIGHGQTTTLSWYGAAGADMILVDSNPYTRYEGLILDGRGIAGIGMHHKNTALFETNIRYKHMDFKNMTDGFYGDGSGTAATAEVSFENCIFDHCSGAGTVMWLNNEYDYTIAGCDYYNCGNGIWCKLGNCYVRDCYFSGSTISDIYLNPEHGCSVRRCKSTGSAMFITYVSNVAPLAVEDCYVTGWTGTAGAMYYSGHTPLTLTDTRFVSPPDSLAPVRLASYAPIIDCANAAPSSPTLYSAPTGSIIYPVPTGAYGPRVGSANGSVITTFIAQSVNLPTVVYDAKVDFSAVGNGIADDTVAIQNTINAAEAHANDVYHQALAYVPAGRYKITAPLVLSGSHWWTFGGSGNGTHLIWGGAAGGTIVQVINPGYVTMENMMVGHHDDGVQNNAIDIEQKYTGTPAPNKMFYDGIYVYGKYQNNPGVKGLRIDGGPNGFAGVGCTLGMVEGNLRFYNVANGSVLNNITYDGAVTVDNPVAGRAGHLMFQTRLSDNNTYSVTLNNSSSITMSDWYQESNSNGISLNGTAADPAGRVTIESPKTGLPVGSLFINATNYKGQVFYGTNQMYPAGATTETISQTGTNPLDIVVFGNAFYNTGLTFSGTTATLETVGDWAHLGSGTPPADSYTTGTLAAMSSAIDDLQFLGSNDLAINVPFVPI